LKECLNWGHNSLGKRKFNKIIDWIVFLYQAQFEIDGEGKEDGKKEQEIEQQFK
jgi:hypothetical protein